MRILLTLFIIATGCPSSSSKDTVGNGSVDEEGGGDSAWWDGIGESDDDDKPNDTGKPEGEKPDDTGKPEGEKPGDCPEDMEPGAPCEGDWTTTLCTDEDGEMWWCEDGVWSNEK
jgi:hypothetical protein